MGDRKRITHHMRLIFGDTFAKGAFFYANPDVHQFMVGRCTLTVSKSVMKARLVSVLETKM